MSVGNYYSSHRSLLQSSAYLKIVLRKKNAQNPLKFLVYGTFTEYEIDSHTKHLKTKRKKTKNLCAIFVASVCLLNCKEDLRRKAQYGNV